MGEARVKRMGGRAARKALRAAPKAEEDKAVVPGMLGGRYKPLSDTDIERIHRAALDVLEQIGLCDAIPSCVELVTAAGGTYTDEGRLLFPRALVEDTLAMAARNIVLHGQAPGRELELAGYKVYFGTAGAAVHIVDVESREYRESTLADLYDIARLVDTLEHIHYFQRPLVARDMVDPRDLDLNTCYASICGTTKHVGSSWVLPEHLQETIPMLHAVAGSEARWRDKPFVSMSACFVVPPPQSLPRTPAGPWRWGCGRACRCCCWRRGQAGATSPAALAGAVVQEVAECLAGLVYVNLIVPGHPAIFAPWPFVSDLAHRRHERRQRRAGGAHGRVRADGALLRSAHRRRRGHGGFEAPRRPVGLRESVHQWCLAGHSGANLVYESAGMLASLLACSYEGYVIDNDMLGAINRTVRGIEVNDESLSIDVMRRCLHQRARALSRPRADPGAHGKRVHLSGGGRSQQPQGVVGAGLHGRSAARP